MKILPWELYKFGDDYAKVAEILEHAKPHVTWFGMYVVRVPDYWFPYPYLILFCDYTYGGKEPLKIWEKDRISNLYKIVDILLPMGDQLIKMKETKNKITKILSDIIDPLSFLGAGTDAAIAWRLVDAEYKGYV
jgi:hypothetical protein